MHARLSAADLALSGMFFFLGILTLAAVVFPRMRFGIRWGRGGSGPPLSATSFLAWGVMIFGIGCATLLDKLGIAKLDAEFILYFVIPGSLFLLFCGIRDSVRQGRVKLPNPSSDPPLASVTPPAEQESRPR